MKEKKTDTNQTRNKIKEKSRSNAGRKKIKANFDKIQKEINLDQVIYWIGLQATAEEIAGAFRVSTWTLNLRLKEEFGLNFTQLKNKLGDGANGKLALRRNQFKLSEHNASMAIWLGKQWLEQKDTIHQETTIKSDNVHVYIPENGREENET